MAGPTKTSVPVILGIDLGVTGAFAYLDEHGNFLRLYDFPNGQPSRLVSTLRAIELPVLAVMEAVHATPGDARRLSSFEKLITNKGYWLGTLDALGVPVLQVAPLKWQNTLFAKESVRRDTKERSVELASKLFPSIGLKKSHHNRADALLIALYGVGFRRNVDGSKGTGGQL